MLYVLMDFLDLFFLKTTVAEMGQTRDTIIMLFYQLSHFMAFLEIYFGYFVQELEQNNKK